MRNLKSFKISRPCVVLILLAGCWFSPAAAQESEADKQFHYARQLAEDGLVDLAVEQYAEFLRLYGDSPLAPQALFNLAQGLERTSSWNEATRRYRQLLIRFPDFPRCDEALYAIHKNQIKMGDLAGAVTSLERFPLFYSKSPLAPQTLLDAGDLHLKRLEFGRAEENWLRLLEEYASSNLIAEVRFRLARLYHQQKKFGPAQAQIDRILDSNPKGDDLARIGLSKAKILADQFDLNQAEALYEMLMAEKLSEVWQGRVRVDYGEYLFRIGDFAKSETTLAPLLNGDKPGMETEAVALWIRLQEKSGNDPEVLGAVSRLVANPGDSTYLIPALFSGVAAAKRQNDLDQAMAFLRSLLSIEKSRGMQNHQLKSVYRELLAIYRKQGWLADALQTGDEAINRFTGDQEFVDRIQFELGLAHLEDLKQPRNALFFFERILSPVKLSGVVDDAAFKRAECYEALGDADMARRLMQEFVDVYPASPYVPEANRRLDWYRYYLPEDPSAELQRTSALISQLLLKAEREATILAFIEQMFDNLKAYEQVVENVRLVEQEQLLKTHKDRLYQLAGESHYRIALRNNELGQRQNHLEQARDYLLKYMASELKPAEELRVALMILDIDHNSDHSPMEVRKADNAAIRALLAKYPKETQSVALRVRLAEQLTSMGPDSAHAAIALYDQVLGPAAMSENGTSAATGADDLEQALYGRAQAHLTQGDTAAAMMDLNAYKKQYPQGKHSLSVLTAGGSIDLASGRYEAAEAGYEALVKRFYYAPQLSDAKMILARIKLDRGNFDDALELLSDLSNEIPEKQGDIVFLTGVAHFGLGDHGSARQYFQDYLLNHGDGPFVGDVYLKLAELGKLAVRPAETSLNHERFLNRFPDDPRSLEVLMDLADSKFAAGDYSGARNDYAKLRTDQRVADRQGLTRKTIIAMIRAGEVAGAQRLMTEFEKTYKEAEGDLAMIQYELGNHYLDQKFFEGAEKLFEKMASRYRKTPYGSYGQYGLGKLKLVTNQTDEALEILTNVIEEHPDAPVMANLLLTLGDFYYKNKQPQNAMSAFERCVALQPDAPTDMSARRYLIQVYKDLGFHEADIQAIRAFLDRYPDAEGAFGYKISIGVNLIELNEYQRAIDHLRSLLSRADNAAAAEIRYHIGDCYFRMGQFRRSISEFLKVNYLTRPTKLPWHVTAKYRSGEAYLKLKEWDKAKLLFSQIVEKEGAGSNFGRVAQGKLTEIEQVYEKQ